MNTVTGECRRAMGGASIAPPRAGWQRTGNGSEPGYRAMTAEQITRELVQLLNALALGQVSPETARIRVLVFSELIRLFELAQRTREIGKRK